MSLNYSIVKAVSPLDIFQIKKTTEKHFQMLNES